MNKFLLTCAAMFALAGCGSLPQKADTETVPQYVADIGGTYVAAKEAAAKIVAIPATPDEVVFALRDVFAAADSVINPLMVAVQSGTASDADLQRGANALACVDEVLSTGDGDCIEGVK